MAGLLSKLGQGAGAAMTTIGTAGVESKMDEARQTRLLKVKEGQAATAAKHQTTEREATQTADVIEQQRQEGVASGEAVLNRKSREKIAGMGGKGRNPHDVKSSHEDDDGNTILVYNNGEVEKIDSDGNRTKAGSLGEMRKSEATLKSEDDALSKSSAALFETVRNTGITSIFDEDKIGFDKRFKGNEDYAIATIKDLKRAGKSEREIMDFMYDKKQAEAAKPELPEGISENMVNPKAAEAAVTAGKDVIDTETGIKYTADGTMELTK